MPFTAGRVSRLDISGPARAEPIKGFGDAMRALFEPLGWLELPEIERRPVRDPPDFSAPDWDAERVNRRRA